MLLPVSTSTTLQSCRDGRTGVGSAVSLRIFLDALGILPGMDTHALLPGMEWATEGGMDSGRCDEAVTEPPRLRRPDRRQVLMQPACLEELVPPDHPVRVVWAVVERLDLSAFSAPLKARGSDPGRSATDPKLLVALWLYAATEGVGSGRELNRLCEEHHAYRWLCGGVSMNYHTLNDFRVGHEQAVDALLTRVLAILMGQGVVTLERVSQDGTRVRASAGSSSFRRRATLEERLKEVRRHVETLKRQLEEPAATSAQRRAARERAARERVERIEAALAELPQIEAAKAQQKAKASKERPARASTTDAQARVMKMGNGGFNPAYNVQFATDTHSRAIVGVEVSPRGSDAGLERPMRQQIEQRTGRRLKEHLMDGGFVTLEGIDDAAQQEVTVYAPPPTPRKAGSSYAARRGDSPAVASWRQRMGTREGQAIYRIRASTAETVNADLKTFRGLSRFLVRGLRKVRCVTLWSVLAYNLGRFAEQLMT